MPLSARDAPPATFPSALQLRPHRAQLRVHSFQAAVEVLEVAVLVVVGELVGLSAAEALARVHGLVGRALDRSGGRARHHARDGVRRRRSTWRARLASSTHRTWPTRATTTLSQLGRLALTSLTGEGSLIVRKLTGAGCLAPAPNCTCCTPSAPGRSRENGQPGKGREASARLGVGYGPLAGSEQAGKR